MRVAIVEYTAQMSGGFARADFSNEPEADPASGGTQILNPDLMGAIRQGNFIGAVNGALPAKRPMSSRSYRAAATPRT